MSIATYSELQTAVANWLSRSDLTSRIPEAIALAEAHFNRHIRHRQMEQRTTSTATEWLALPSDYLELRNVKLQGTPYTALTLISPSDADRLYTSASDKPAYYVLQGNQIRLVPAPDASTYTIELDYFKQIPALSVANTTNWLLTDAPDLYLYGTCFHALTLVADDGRAQGCSSLMNSLIEQINGRDREQRWSGSPMRTRAG